MREKYYCGLDLGSQSIKAGLLKVKDAMSIELAGVCEKKTYGFKDASVSDLGELSECIHSVTGELVKKTGIKFKQVHLGVGAEFIDIRHANTVIPLVDRGTKIITRHDVQKANDQARLLALRIEEEILHDVPQHYVVDEINRTTHPVGLYGRKLGVSSLMIATDTTRIRNIIRAVHQAGHDVPHVFFSSYVSCGVALNDVERVQGCFLVDIGSRTTVVLGLKEKILRSVGKIHLGGDHFTQSLAERFQLSLDLAEEMKKSHVSVLRHDQNREEEILVKRENAYRPVQRKNLCRSIEPEVESFLQGIQTLITESGLSEQIGGDIVVIGGGALLPGLIERIAEATERPVRLGKININSRQISGNAALFVSAAGLAEAGFRKRLGYSMNQDDSHATWAKRAANRLRELYQEYF